MRKVTEKGRVFGAVFDQILFKNDSTNHQNKFTEQKGSQNGSKIDAQTHQKPLPKQVSKKIMEIIENNVSLKGKTIEIHIKNKCI